MYANCSKKTSKKDGGKLRAMSTGAGHRGVIVYMLWPFYHEND